MLPLKVIQEDKEQVIARLAIKNFDARQLVDQVLSLDQNRRQLQHQYDQKQSELNEMSRKIGDLFKAGKKEEAGQMKDLTIQLKEDLKNLLQESAQVEAALDQKIIELPNLPHESVPPGKTPLDNVIVRSGGIIPRKQAGWLPHWELGRKYDILDFDLGNKLTGAGFPVFKGKGAKLERSLINFFLDEGEKAGYLEIQPPIMVNEDSGFGTGQLPDKEGMMYGVPIDKYYLIPTAEVPVTNIYRDVILKVTDFPIKNMAYTPCFRREAGSYGKDVRGLNRVHQFDKVEIVQIAHPDHSYEQLEEMVTHVESLVQKLELPYRIVKLCGGDMSFTSALTYDFEVFSGAQEKWLEVSSVSNFESFQANRLKLRFKDPAGKKNRLAHTLNGSALALPRIVAALLENNQSPQGIRIPEKLVSYTGFALIG
jgi:seryl-tRNA synthetase